MARIAKTEIHFVTGKGGVGKSTVAAALALQLVQKGKKTLLVELGNQSFYKDYFELQNLSYHPQELRNNLYVALWSGGDCLKEYAQYLLKVEALYRLLFENKISRALINVAPGLPELSIIGKITSGPPRNVGPELGFDSLVVDGFATGHFLALLKAPRGMSEIIRLGPMGEQTKGILKILSNPDISHYWVVSLPEELPVQEALELSAAIEKETGIRPRQVLNKYYANLADVHGGSVAFADFVSYQSEKQAKAIVDLSGYPTICLAPVFKTEPWKIVEPLAKEIAL